MNGEIHYDGFSFYIGDDAEPSYQIDFAPTSFKYDAEEIDGRWQITIQDIPEVVLWANHESDIEETILEYFGGLFKGALYQAAMGNSNEHTDYILSGLRKVPNKK